jgi:hypothetical protein
MNWNSKILFFSTGDSMRRQMAEGFLRTLAGDELIAVSTAVESPGKRFQERARRNRPKCAGVGQTDFAQVAYSDMIRGLK